MAMLRKRFGYRQCLLTISIMTLAIASVVATQVASDAPDLEMHASIREEGSARWPHHRGGVE